MVDRWRSIVAFVRTVERGSFVAAGRALGVTPSAVGKAVALLEQELGVPLLARSTRSMTPTTEGRAFYERARQAVELIQDASREATGAQASAHGRLCINVHSNLGRLRVLPALADFLARQPGLSLDVRMSPAPLNLAAEDIDIVVRILQPPDSTMIGRQIGQLTFVTCASKEYLARHGEPRDPSDLARHNCLLYVLPEGAVYDHWRFERGDDVREVTVRGNVRVDDGHSIADLAVRGAGIAHLLVTTVEGHIAAGRLVPLLGAWKAPGPPIYVMYRRSARQSVRVRAFLEFITDVFRNEAVSSTHLRRQRRVRGRS